MTLISRLLARWDFDAGTSVSTPFDRLIVHVNLRRVELGYIVLLISVVLDIVIGVPGLPKWVMLVVGALGAWLSHRVLHWRSLPAQQWATIVLVSIPLVYSIWIGAELSSRAGHLQTNYRLFVLCMVVLTVVPPRSLAWIVAGMFAAYALVVARLPVPAAEKIGGIVDTGIASGAAQLGGWLTYSARRSLHEQKRLIGEQNERLSERNRELDQLMAITAHDLRSPLFGVRNLLDLAARRAQANRASPLDSMREAITGLDALIGLVSRLLDAHSAECEPLDGRVCEDVRDHLAEAARRIGPVCQAGGVILELALDEGPLLAAFDSLGLSRTLDNLLDNAVRFSSPGGRVRITGVRDGGAAVVVIEDQGPGFDAAGRAAMFSKFHPRGCAPNGKAGKGLGLFIARTFAQRMGATLRFEPVQPTGSRFLLTLPTDDR